MGYIYVIKNTVNEKVYIGQTMYNPKFRLKYYINKASQGYTNKIARAIREIGESCFFIEILEEVDNDKLDIREEFYIKHFNSTVYGYNTQTKSKQTRNYSPKQRISSEILHKLFTELIETKNLEQVIQNNQQVHKKIKSIVQQINYGKIYRQNVDYPIVPTKKTQKLSSKEADSIKEHLKSNVYTMQQLKDMYKVSATTITNINKGIVYFDSTLKYPIRIPEKWGYIKNNGLYDKIVYLLKKGCIYKDIANTLNISISTVNDIDKGRTYINSEEKYPIRKHRLLKKDSIMVCSELLSKEVD